MKDMRPAATTSDPELRTLGVFAKQPLPGHVKTRLAAETSPHWAANAAHAFLNDLLARLAAVAARRVLVFAPAGADAFFTDLVQGRFTLCPQAEGDLGQRMAAFVRAQLQAGAEQIVLVGADSPTLPLAFIDEAFRQLEQTDVVFGPATDGGYYLLGCARRLPPLFDGIAWGGPRVLLDSVACLLRSSWRLAVLPPWYDVDTLSDWWALRGHLRALRAAGHDPGVPRTEQLADP
jgi:rSAM/selenodomain-associated transferase 1